jgi:hypothetical protein
MFKEVYVVTESIEYFDNDFKCVIQEGGEIVEHYFVHNGEIIPEEEANNLMELDLYPEVIYYSEEGEDVTKAYVWGA